ncbi:MAG TPA: L-aspartate oxidase [Candidatus Eisenbacteria bacterium]|jgi:L-aspartate oxidase|nr:L-aspartate oxidase [Candidatus Eisenbacteria bacterium]
MNSVPKTYHADYAVVGSGVAGLRAAIELSAAGTVLVLAKSDLSESATAYAQGGIAVALSDEDEIGLHEQDTIAAGDGLCRPESVALLVEEGPKYITQLIEWGTEFDRAGTKLAFTREAAHSRSRILHAHGDSTGREISRALLARAHALPHLHLRAHAFTTSLILENGRAVGLRFLDETDGSLHEVRAGAVLLATGGLGQLYRETTNPAVATGDGMAIAFEAGAVLSDMEFVQFHPTALAIKGAPRFLLSEALRGEGGILRNANLERFMKRYAEAQELAPRDVVARAIVSEMHRTQAEHVYLDMTAKSAEFLQKRFPRIYSTCLSYGLDLATDMAPVCPAAHYMMGGVKSDLWGRTSVPGLYAAGETADTGVHGANRLASNSLLEGLVFGARAGEAMSKDAPAAKHKTTPLPGTLAPKPGNSAPGTLPSHPQKPAAPTQLSQIRDLMWRHVGILRSGKDLSAALAYLQKMELPSAATIAGASQQHHATSTVEAARGQSASTAVAAAKDGSVTRSDFELFNLHTLATLIARSALAREESRGSHYRSDFPYRDDEAFQKHSLVQRSKDVTFES